MKLVSIIMTCHNGERYLKDAVLSILTQTYKNWELIFIDNNSTDDSKNIILSFDDKRINYFKSEKTFTRNFDIDSKFYSTFRALLQSLFFQPSN